ncbi:MAG: SpoIID/LytB domain-containing protein [Bacteroidales bacterium]|jgi:stage II sporulation protein D|nr:SpoIID/LytB domain-containing protein [Bacteroidales bacterium]MCR4931174.1 SpoIID/LytB domain-containing protein [Bacteroidales bacterium]
MKRVAIILLLLLSAFTASADKIKVRLFSNSNIEAINVSFDLGLYDLYANDTLLLEPSLGEGMSVELLPTATGVKISVNGYEYGIYKQACIMATDTACIMCLNPTGVKQRTYEGDLLVSAYDKSNLRIINSVEFETYLAGVVQSEIYGQQSDIFRIQAVISRTWALRNMKKHRADGFNFCDYVHCQAYQNRCVRPDIMLGTMQSSGETIVDADGNLIDTPFHSNSGGQTANSEDVWRTALPYLRSVQDTFSYRMRQSNWTKVISKDKWLNYFSKTHKLNTQDPEVRNTLLTFSQPQRQARILGVPLTRVRTDFGLKSTFFSVSTDSKTGDVILSGHGYGHGVGLSQEGTIRMVSLGIAYDSIIRHYYTGAQIHHDENTSEKYVEHFVTEITKIIDEDKANPGQKKSKKDDWLGKLFRVRDRMDREEEYDPTKDEKESDWKIEW